MCSRSLRAFLCSIVVSGLVACGWSQPLPKHAWTIPSECERLELHVASDEQGHRQMRWAALEPWLRCVDANGSLRPLLRWVDGWNSHDKERIAQWFSSAFLNSDQNGLGSRLWGLVGVFNSQTQSTGTLIAELLAEKEWIDSLARLQADLEWHGGFFEQWADLLAVLRVVESAVEQPFLNDFFNHLREAQWNGESSERPSEWDAAWKGMQRFAQVSVSQGLYDPWSTSLELLSSGSFLESMQRVWDLEEPNIRAHLSDAKQMFEHHLFQKDNWWVFLKTS